MDNPAFILNHFKPEMTPLILPEIPPVNGLSFRNPYGEEDAEALAAIHAGRAEVDAVDPGSILESLPTEEEIRTALAKAAAAKQLDRWLVAEVNGLAVG